MLGIIAHIRDKIATKGFLAECISLRCQGQNPRGNRENRQIKVILGKTVSGDNFQIAIKRTQIIDCLHSICSGNIRG